jgi:predicted dehydrogenase
LAARVRADQPIEGMVGPEFNVDVMQIVEAARRSAESGQPVNLPLR